jgi:hypothetical protein
MDAIAPGLVQVGRAEHEGVCLESWGVGAWKPAVLVLLHCKPLATRPRTSHGIGTRVAGSRMTIRIIRLCRAWAMIGGGNRFRARVTRWCHADVARFCYPAWGQKGGNAESSNTGVGSFRGDLAVGASGPHASRRDAFPLSSAFNTGVKTPAYHHAAATRPTWAAKPGHLLAAQHYLAIGHGELFLQKSGNVRARSTPALKRRPTIIRPRRGRRGQPDRAIF